MNKQSLIRLIKESRDLIKTASPEQKIRLLRLIKESYRKLKESQQPKVLVENPEPRDYLEEK
jgi:hypothetical protein